MCRVLVIEGGREGLGEGWREGMGRKRMTGEDKLVNGSREVGQGRMEEGRMDGSTWND